jgi:hypothetical protein
LNINDFIGIPYRSMDCYAFVRHASEALFKRPLPAVEDYRADPAGVLEMHRPAWARLDAPVDGCVVVLGQSPRYAKHVGLWLAGGVLHSTIRYGSVYQDELQLLSSGYTNLAFYQWGR